MVLEAIRYQRGSLQLLEQRRLPQDTEWVQVCTAKDGWQAIRDMTVRGAPAIGISAALSLAVELSGGGSGTQFSSAKEAVDFIGDRLDLLATSRPTAVNLFEAVNRLKRVADEASNEDGAEGETVAEAVITAAELMLEEDVAANRRMGRFGAEALLKAAQDRGRASNGKLRVLTHCNTGSLATAAYGTALGVIRSLHESGHLVHAYCTETRPYNQGARLTAYELTHDGLPSTLICDSAAAALMASGKVDAVVVGADRVAANGDTANKIGTFSLAVAASYHDVPFFIAAPTTTIDLDLVTGGLIPIEERSPEEITHFRGQRVAADIDVWNPSFDVTPAKLIEGIITEEGLIPRSTSNRNFEISSWLPNIGGAHAKGKCGAKQAPNDRSEKDHSKGAEAEFVQLTIDSVKDYVAERPQLCKHVGDPSSQCDWQAEEVGDGNLNFVFILRGPSGSICIKQAPPYVRCVGEDWPLTQNRIRIESAALDEECRHCPSHVPALLHVDKPMCLLVMEYIPPPHVILRKGLIQGNTYKKLPNHISSFLALTLFNTSLLAMPSDRFRALAAKFNNTELCRLTEQVIFTDPYFNAKFNRHTSPQLDRDAKELQEDAVAKAAVARLKSIFMQKQQALLHGDLHTGSLMVTEETTYVIDPEFAFVGPMAFDIGKILSNLLLAFFAADGHATGDYVDAAREGQKAWLLNTVVEIWHNFQDQFLKLWNEKHGQGDAVSKDVYGDDVPAGPEAQHKVQEAFFDELWDETVGFMGAVMIRRIFGIAHIEDFESIEDQDKRAECECHAIRLGRRLLAGGGRAFPSVEDVVRAAAS